MKPNFSGYATKYGVQCTDGRTIVADAFKHEHGKRVPLLWRHDDSSPDNVLGHAILQHIDGDGVRADAFFNKSPRGVQAKETVEHEDISMLSIKAVRLQQRGTEVYGGSLTEVSLVPAGANSEARIDSVYMTHADGYVNEIEDSGIIHTGIQFELLHEDDESDAEESNDESDEGKSDDAPDKTAQEVYDTLNDEQKTLVDALVGMASQSSSASHEDTFTHEGDQMPNVFDQTDKSEKTSVLTHEQIVDIFADAEKTGSLKASVLEHAEQYGITNIEDLFPNHKQTTNRPEWIKREDSWVAKVLSSVKSSPFTRIKTMTADLTHEEARAKGYIKGNMKKEQFFRVASRVTDATTIYKKQKLDRDDILDITDFDVVAWIKEEMRFMLQEELARAILFGDNRPSEDPASPGNPNPDKIDETRLRPIATDDDFYTAKVSLGTGTAAKDLAKVILRSRKLLKGSTGKPTLFTTDDLVVDLLLMEDKLGRRYYETEASLAAALGVKEIVVVDVLEDGYSDEENGVLRGLLVNLADYTVGANPGGAPTMFDDFDIDYNKYKYLIETRRSGALTRHRSAVSLWENSGTEVFPIAPNSDGTSVTIPTVEGVTYYKYSGTQDAEAVSDGEVIEIGSETLYVEARPDSGYRFPFNVTSDWSYSK